MNQFASPLIILVAFFVLLFTYTKLAGPIPFTFNISSVTTTDTFSVTGEGKSTAKPDVALITVGITENGNSVKDVQDKINSVINQVSTKIKALGIDEKDIKTANYNINPTYDFNSGLQKITGFTANTNLNIKVRNIEKANSVIDAATSAGANQVGGITFDIDDKTKVEDEARQEAVKEARKKAEQAAKTAGFSLGRIINYSENFGGQTPVPLFDRVGTATEIKTPTAIEPGSSEIRVTVTLSYEIR